MIHVLHVLDGVFGILIFAIYCWCAYRVVPGLGISVGATIGGVAFFMGCASLHLVLGILMFTAEDVIAQWPWIVYAMLAMDTPQVIGGAIFVLAWEAHGLILRASYPTDAKTPHDMTDRELRTTHRAVSDETDKRADEREAKGDYNHGHSHGQSHGNYHHGDEGR